MSIVDKFGEKVGEIAENDPVKARKLLLAGYRLQEKRLALFPDRKLPMSGQYVAKIVMNNIIQALAKPENAAIKSKTRPNTASMAPIAMPRSSADSTYKNVSFAFFFNPCKSCDGFMVFLFFHNPFFISYMRHMNN